MDSVSDPHTATLACSKQEPFDDFCNILFRAEPECDNAVNDNQEKACQLFNHKFIVKYDESTGIVPEGNLNLVYADFAKWATWGSSEWSETRNTKTYTYLAIGPVDSAYKQEFINLDCKDYYQSAVIC